MATLEDLRTSISEMTDEELAEHFRQIRLNRRVGATKHKEKKAQATASKKPSPNVNINPASLSADAAAELLKLLEAE